MNIKSKTNRDQTKNAKATATKITTMSIDKSWMGVEGNGFQDCKYVKTLWGGLITCLRAILAKIMRPKKLKSFLMCYDGKPTRWT